jgi:hypothetical protein
MALLIATGFDQSVHQIVHQFCPGDRVPRPQNRTSSATRSSAAACVCEVYLRPENGVKDEGGTL